MLKKADLSKQFELVVQQEIKNYQDSLNFILQTIRQLKDSIQEARTEALENYALIHSQQVDLCAQIQALHLSHSDSQKRLQNHINDSEFFKQKAINEIATHAYRGIENSKKIEYIENKHKYINLRLETFEDEMKGNSLLISNSFDNIKFNMAKDSARMKQEILSLPSEAESLRKDFDEKITANKVDVECILKEIRINRKEMVILEKKIENIYTLIERLKKPEVLP